MFLEFTIYTTPKTKPPKQNIRIGIVNHKNQLIPCSYK